MRPRMGKSFTSRRCSTSAAAPGLARRHSGRLSTALAGVDLSPNMVELARGKKIYDRLAVGDIMTFLADETTNTHDLVLAADVFAYFADLAPVISASASALAPSGLLAFTVETHAGDGIILSDKLRYAHGAAHVRAACDVAGLRAVLSERSFDTQRSRYPRFRALSWWHSVRRGIRCGAMLDKLPILPDIFARWFADRGWEPRAHQLELLAKAQAGRSALLIAPTGAGKTLAGFLPTLVELSEPRASRKRRNRNRSSPPAAAYQRGGGLHTLYISPLKALAVDIARNLGKAGRARWACRSASRRVPATRRPPSACASAATRRTSCSLRRSNLRCCSRPPTGPYLFSSLRRIVLDELHSLVMSKRGDLLSLDLAQLFRLAPHHDHRLASPPPSPQPEDLCRYLVPQVGQWRAGRSRSSPTAAPQPIVTTLNTSRTSAVGRPLRAPRHS